MEVELDDELDPLPEQPRLPRRPWSVRRWAWATSALAVVLAVVTVATGVDVASRATPVPGDLTADLTVPRHELWTAAGAQLVGAVGDLVLVSDSYGQDVRALRVTDGTEVWQAGGTCTLASLAGYTTAQIIGGAPVLGDPRDARVVCTDQGSATPGTRLLDAATGDVLVQVPEDSTVIGGYLVHVGSEVPFDRGQESRTMSVRSLVDGTELWTRDLDTSESRASWGVTPTALVRVDGSAMSEVDLESGRITPVPEGAVVPLIELPLADGLRATTGWRSSTQLSVVVADAGGRELWSRDGDVAIPAAVQGPDAGAVLLTLGSAGELVAYDSRSGTELWRWTAETGIPLVHAGGVVLIATGAPSAVDERSGEVRWTAPVGEVVLSASDGATLLLRDGSSGDLVVRDLGDGHEVTRYALPGLRETALVQDVVALSGGRLAMITTDGLTLLAP